MTEFAMHKIYVDRTTLLEFLDRLNGSFGQPGRLYLVGDTIQVYEGWIDWTKRLEFSAELTPEDRPNFDEIVQELQRELGISLLEEALGDVIPLPAGHENRSRPVENGFEGPLQLYHFDPYSVSFRLITRGDEPDYRAVLAFLERGWVQLDEMNGLLDDLLPEFTNETIQQDPAEFRRKYRGLLQMWRAKQLQA